ncbi:hypothetical protein IFM89_021782 [Coptis chinensis]|uniref:Peroxisomal multifunctional enzyme type 2-like N-terminal domain-containing protein n=1 Tax=Coptis chinensis TaxID=261450 RepID=A0A835ITT6_9MAGN|nr:hypothetical protein IFM89_021782 [Coptis chinensis]
MASSSSTASTDPQLIISHKFPETTLTYTERDVALYALGVGACARDPLDEEELKYVYHKNGQPFVKVLPTFAAIVSMGAMGKLEELQGLKYDPRLLLHGQQYIEIYKPFPSSACVSFDYNSCMLVAQYDSGSHGALLPPDIENRSVVAGFHDKGKAAIIDIETTSYDKGSGEALCKNRSTIYLRGAGGFSKSSSPFTYSNYPADQASVFSPNIAWVVHGFLPFGAIIKCLCNGEPTMVTSIFGRLLLHVYPGETLVTEMWLEGSRVIYQTKVKERDRAVLMGYVGLKQATSSM